MKNSFNVGDIKCYEKKIAPEDTAAFHGKEVHPVYATFALARDMEWASRLFVLEMKEEDEEGVGTKLCIEHLQPAFVDEHIEIRAQLECVKGNEIDCAITVVSGGRELARGKTSQKILKKEKIKKKISSLQRLK